MPREKTAAVAVATVSSSTALSSVMRLMHGLCMIRTFPSNVSAPLPISRFAATLVA